MATIFQIADQQRAALLARDHLLLARISQLYGDLAADVRAELELLTHEARIALQRGEELTRSWFARQKQLKKWLAQIEARMDSFAIEAAVVTTAEQKSLTVIAGQNIAEFAGGFGNIQAEAAEAFVGFAGNGSPLTKIFRSIGPDVAKRVEETLFSGIAKGQNPMVTARQLERDAEVGRTRAETIARTETLRAYREASQENAKANSDVLLGWYWMCSKSDRTCAACLAMDGTFHRMRERLVSHPNCRCTQVWTTEVGPTPQRGSAWFREQPALTQDFILGPTAGALYRKGEVKLEDFVGYKRDQEWGNYYYKRPLQDAIGKKRVHPGYKRPAA